MSRVAVLSTSSIAVIVVAFKFVADYDSALPQFWVGVALFLVSFYGLYVAQDWAKQSDKKRDTDSYNSQLYLYHILKEFKKLNKSNAKKEDKE